VKTNTLLIGLIMMSAVSFAGATTHVVKSGDNMYRIALNYGVSLKQLQGANPGVSAQSLRIGQKLVIPTRGAAAVARESTDAPVAKSSPTPAPRAAASGTYEVKAGDSLSKIARQQGTTVAALQAANPNLNPNRMAIGQKINLSGSAGASTGSSASIAKSSTPSPAPAPVKQTEPVEQPAPAVAKQDPAPAPQPVAAAETELPVKQSTPEPAPAMADTKSQTVNNPAPEAAAQPAATAYRLIKTTRELTLAEVAKENNTTTEKINALNGWSFSPQTLLAVDSELYIPAQP
jgi:LysM repeat protein